MKRFLRRAPDEPHLRAARRSRYVIRSSRTGSSGFVNELGQAVWSINPNLPLASVRTLQEIYDASLARTSFTLVMLGIAGGMALLLGVAGIYGVISYSVSQRTREIGIRIALGAQAQAVTRMFVAHGLTLAGVGVAIGLTAAFGDHAADVLAAVRGQPGRSADLRAGVAGADCRDRARQLCAGPARHGCGSDRGAQIGVAGTARPALSQERTGSLPSVRVFRRSNTGGRAHRNPIQNSRSDQRMAGFGRLPTDEDQQLKHDSILAGAGARINSDGFWRGSPRS